MALVAIVALVLQLRGAGEGEVSAPTTSTAATSTPTPAAPSTARRSWTPSDAPSNSASTVGEPVSITIESGGVDSPLVPQGLAPDGTINPGRNEVIWFTGSDRVSPGQVGTAVIAAHVTWEGQPDAFISLPEVAVGDEITVGYDDGSTMTFTVTQTSAVDKEQLARSLSVWGPHPDRPRLAIITCDPVLGYQSDGHTAANFVVIAEG